MTLIIGMFYNGGSGAAIISDSRMMIGPDYSKERKVVELEGGIIFAASGYSGMTEKLIPAVQQARVRSRQFLPGEVVNLFEDEMAALWRRYKGGTIPRFAPDDTLLTGIVGFVEGDEPKLFCLHENGYAESIGEFRAIGDGSRHAHNIIKNLHNKTLSKDEALQIGVHAIMQVATVDAVVDEYPQIALFEKGIGPADIKILNCSDTDEFAFECQEIDKIKARVNGIEKKRTEVFSLLLNGTEEVKKKLNDAIKEYEDEQAQTPEEAPPAEQ